ncbi:MAG: low molecular weight phosphotyrosine protein phosphatase, partial [Muribaculum sp.]|nr:low molecular weight phosphotyrosine protein phosphatase [Muribaculum sp.]
ESVKENHTSNLWTIDSAGTGNYHIGDLPDPRMRAHARRRGLQLTHHCRQVRETDFDNFDLIIGMDASNISNLSRMAPTVEAEAKILPMSDFFSISTKYDYVPDPYYDGAEGFELVLDLLTDATRNLRDTVEAYHANSLA